MPQVEPDPQLKRTMLEVIKQEHSLGGERTGIHVSDLTACLTKAYWAKTDPQQPSDTEIGLWSIGWSLERVIIPRLHVEPFEVDGITMSLDFQLPDGTIADLKTTRMAPQGRKGEGGFQMPESWLRQFAAYRYGWNQRPDLPCLSCGHVHQTGKCQTAIPHFCSCPTAVHPTDFGVVVVHLIPAEITCWRVTWTEQELNNLWVEMLERANVLENLLATGEPHPFQYNLGDWECRGCSRLTSCQLAGSLERMKGLMQ